MNEQRAHSGPQKRQQNVKFFILLFISCILSMSQHSFWKFVFICVKVCDVRVCRTYLWHMCDGKSSLHALWNMVRISCFWRKTGKRMNFNQRKKCFLFIKNYKVSAKKVRCAWMRWSSIHAKKNSEIKYFFTRVVSLRLMKTLFMCAWKMIFHFSPSIKWNW